MCIGLYKEIEISIHKAQKSKGMGKVYSQVHNQYRINMQRVEIQRVR